FAIGDVITGPMLAHKASEAGVIAVECMAGQPAHVNYDAIPNIVYTWPELASVGLSEEEAAARGLAVAVGTFPFVANGRARCLNETDGGVKVLADARTDRIVGLHILGPGASDDATSHRSFADVEQWVAVFDDPARDAYQKPREVVRALRIRPGMRVADVGAGTGYFSRYLSAAVGAAGTVLAVDTEPELVRYLRERAEKEKTDNVVPILASPDNPRLPRGAVDLVLLVDTFHHIDHRVAYFGSLRRTLAPGGRVAVVDWQKRETPVGPEL